MSRIMPAMADGRCVTSYVPACAYDFYMQKKFNVMGNAKYRAFLQASAPSVYAESRKLHVCGLNPRFLDVVRTSGKPVARLVQRRTADGRATR
jgi:hypothetical protein